MSTARDDERYNPFDATDLNTQARRSSSQGPPPQGPDAIRRSVVNVPVDEARRAELEAALRAADMTKVRAIMLELAAKAGFDRSKVRLDPLGTGPDPFDIHRAAGDPATTTTQSTITHPDGSIEHRVVTTTVLDIQGGVANPASAQPGGFAFDHPFRDDAPVALGPVTASTDPAFFSEIDTLLRQGKSIEAIKRYRARTGARHADAEKAIYAWAALHGHTKAITVRTRSGCLRVVFTSCLLLLVLPAAALAALAALA